MGLLRRRPLALFCTCFLVALFVASYVSSFGKILCSIFIISYNLPFVKPIFYFLDVEYLSLLWYNYL